MASSRDLETERIAKEFDFSELERICGRELSFFEKRDAIYRFNEFVSFLKAEYGRMLGAEIFITRDSENLEKEI